MIRRDKMKKTLFTCLLATLLVVLVVPIIFAIPVPHGIDGHVYDLDGITPAGNAYFSVNDTTTGEYIQGRTRSNGYYSVSMDGSNGDIILVKVWNQYHESAINLTLNGVMHGVDLLLNMSWPNYPPSIISEPIPYAYVGRQYKYDVDAVDPENDTLRYRLIKYPLGMKIYGTTGIITWTPKKRNLGINTIVVEVSDSNLTDMQVFNITVQDKAALSTLSTAVSSPVEFLIEKSSVEKVVLNGLIEGNYEVGVNELVAKPYGIISPTKLIYKYIEMKADFKNAILSFKVDKGWLASNDANIEDVALIGYYGGVWRGLPTKHIKSSEGYEHFEAEISKSEYLAISLKDSKLPLKISPTGPTEEYILSGVIYVDRKHQADMGTEIIITNRKTGQSIRGKTGFASNSGGYYTIIKGSLGDLIDIEVIGSISKKITVELEGDNYNLDLFLNDNSPWTSGFVTASKTGLLSKTSLPIVFIFVTLFLILTSLAYLKKRHRK